MPTSATVTAFPRAPRCSDVARRGRPTKQAVAELELEARRQEAGQLKAAHRHVANRLLAALLAPGVEAGPDAMQMLLHLRDMVDRYARRWEPEP